MPLSLDDIVQSSSGSTGAGAAASSFNVTLPSGTTAGNTVIIGIGFAGAASLLNTPTNFARDANQGKHYLFRKSNVGAAETSWTVACTSLTARAAWWVMEVANLDLDDPVDGSATNGDAAPQPSGTVSTNSAIDTIVLASHYGGNTSSAAPTWSGQTNGFTELAEGTTSAGATSNAGVAVSYLFPGTIGPFSSTATESVASTSSGLLVVYKSATAISIGVPAYHTGFEFGHGGGLVTGAATARLASSVGGTIGTDVIVQAGSAKNGSYGLRVALSAANARSLAWTPNAGSGLLPNSKDGYAVDFWLRIPSASGTTNQMALVSDSAAPVAGSVELIYNASTSKLGVRWIDGNGSNAGTVTYQSGTTATNTWVRVGIAYWGVKGTTRNMLWALDGTAETALAQVTGAVASTLGVQYVALGHFFNSGSSTYTADYDDLRISTTKGDHPLPDQRVILLGVDTGGTVTLSGTTGNFQTFTSNGGTLTAWNATTARNNVDELPPTISGSADGVAQITAAGSDYMEFPMATYTLADGEMIVGVRALVAGWGAGAPAAATIGLRGWDGTTETVLWAVADPSFNNSTTAPGWLSCPWNPGGRWTQAKLDAAALRLGFSGDATPDIGAHALYLEVVIGTATTQALFGDTATAGVDPGWQSVVDIEVAAPSMGTGDTTLEYEVGGTPTTVNVPAGTTVVEQIDAATAADVNRITLWWPPEPDPVA